VIIFKEDCKKAFEALGFFCSSKHMPLKEALEGEQSRWNSSVYMPAKKNS